MTDESFVFTLPFCYLRVDIVDDKLVGTEYLSLNTKANASCSTAPRSRLARQVAEQISHYLEKPANGFSLATELKGTPFQKSVWRQLQKIPAGKTKTYGELAIKLQSSPRAVGNACRANPVPLIVPCHRVISASGFGGFAGKTTGWMPRLKQQLLQHEGFDSRPGSL